MVSAVVTVIVTVIHIIILFVIVTVTIAMIIIAITIILPIIIILLIAINVLLLFITTASIVIVITTINIIDIISICLTVQPLLSACIKIIVWVCIYIPHPPGSHHILYAVYCNASPIRLQTAMTKTVPLCLLLPTSFAGTLCFLWCSFQMPLNIYCLVYIVFPVIVYCLP